MRCVRIWYVWFKLIQVRLVWELHFCVLYTYIKFSSATTIDITFHVIQKLPMSMTDNRLLRSVNPSTGPCQTHYRGRSFAKWKSTQKYPSDRKLFAVQFGPTTTYPHKAMSATGEWNTNWRLTYYNRTQVRDERNRKQTPGNNVKTTPFRKDHHSCLFAVLFLPQHSPNERRNEERTDDFASTTTQWNLWYPSAA